MPIIVVEQYQYGLTSNMQLNTIVSVVAYL